MRNPLIVSCLLFATAPLSAGAATYALPDELEPLLQAKTALMARGVTTADAGDAVERDASFYAEPTMSSKFSIAPSELPSVIVDAEDTSRIDPSCGIACKGISAGVGAGLNTDRSVFTTLFPAGEQSVDE